MSNHKHRNPIEEDKGLRLFAITVAGAIVIAAAGQTANINAQETFDDYSLNFVSAPASVQQLFS